MFCLSKKQNKIDVFYLYNVEYKLIIYRVLYNKYLLVHCTKYNIYKEIKVVKIFFFIDGFYTRSISVFCRKIFINYFMNYELCDATLSALRAHS